jgi:hypothetical protein
MAPYFTSINGSGGGTLKASSYSGGGTYATIDGNTSVN